MKKVLLVSVLLGGMMVGCQNSEKTVVKDHCVMTENGEYCHKAVIKIECYHDETTNEKICKDRFIEYID